jgi:hypothetical protein
MTLAEFLNALRIMRSIDSWDLEEAGIVVPYHVWVSFRDNPYDWLIKASDNEAAQLWTIIQRRQKS